MNFQHRLVTPEWPQANSMVESFMKNLSQVIRSVIIEKVPWRTTRLPQFKSLIVPAEADQMAIRIDK